MKHNQAGAEGLGHIINPVWTLNFPLFPKQSLPNVSRKTEIILSRNVERVLPFLFVRERMIVSHML
jgi:hypothetical protein